MLNWIKFKRLLVLTLVFLVTGIISFLPAQGAENSLTIAAVGDVMMGTENLLPADKGNGLFASSAKFIKEADIGFFNLESTLTDSGKSIKDTESGLAYIFKTPPSYTRHLTQAGFNMASIANNHINDLGEEGKANTILNLRQQNITFSGPPGSTAHILIKEIKVAMVAFAPYLHSNNLLNLSQAREQVSKLAHTNDIVIVSMHAGTEGEEATRITPGEEIFNGEKRGDVVRFAHAMIDAGADLILGHGPHVPRAMEIYKGRLIAYSLGNFVTERGIRITGRAGLAPLLMAELDREGRLLGGRVISFAQTRGKKPWKDESNRAARFIYDLGVLDFPQSNALNKEGLLILPKP